MLGISCHHTTHYTTTTLELLPRRPLMARPNTYNFMSLCAMVFSWHSELNTPVCGCAEPAPPENCQPSVAQNISLCCTFYHHKDAFSDVEQLHDVWMVQKVNDVNFSQVD